MHLDRSALASLIVSCFVASLVGACSSAVPDSPLQGEAKPANSSKSGRRSTGSNDDDEQTTKNGSGTNTTAQQNGTDPAEDPAAPGTPGTPGTSGTSGTPANGQCASKATRDACFGCCDQAFPGGLELDAQAFGECVCETPGTCAQACGTSYCAGGPPTAACQQCLGSATQCNQTAETACNANAACKGAMACVESSGCNQKQP